MPVGRTVTMSRPWAGECNSRLEEIESVGIGFWLGANPAEGTDELKGPVAKLEYLD